MRFFLKLLKSDYLFTVMVLFFGLLTTDVSASTLDAQYWVDQGLMVSELSPNSDEEAMCYRRALELNNMHVSALFNLAYVLDMQVTKDWAKKAPVWADLEKLYEAFGYYFAGAIIKPAASAISLSCDEEALLISALL